MDFQHTLTSRKEVIKISKFNKGTKNADGTITHEFWADTKIEMYHRVKDLFLDKGWTFETPVEPVTVNADKKFSKTNKKNVYRGTETKTKYRCVMRSYL